MDEGGRDRPDLPVRAVRIGDADLECNAKRCKGLCRKGMVHSEAVDATQGQCLPVNGERAAHAHVCGLATTPCVCTHACRTPSHACLRMEGQEVIGARDPLVAAAVVARLQRDARMQLAAALALPERCAQPAVLDHHALRMRVLVAVCEARHMQLMAFTIS